MHLALIVTLHLTDYSHRCTWPLVSLAPRLHRPFSQPPRTQYHKGSDSCYAQNRQTISSTPIQVWKTARPSSGPYRLWYTPPVYRIIFIVLALDVLCTVDFLYSRARGDLTRDYRDSCYYAERPYYGINRRGRSSTITNDAPTSALATDDQNREPESLTI